MRKLALFIVMILLALTGSVNMNADLRVVGSSLMDREVLINPLKSLRFNFNEKIEVSENAEAVIYCDERVIERVPLTVDGTGSFAVSGSLKDPMLPIGFQYKVVIPDGVVFSASDPQDKLAGFSCRFEVPENFELTPQIDIDNKRLESLPTSWNIFQVKGVVESVPGIKAVLYRNWAKVREFDIYCSLFDPTATNPDIGIVSLMCKDGFGKGYLETGVHYRLVIPEAAVFAEYREDIYSQKRVVEFEGTYEGDFPVVEYSSWSISDAGGNGRLGKVSFRYEGSVAATDSPRMYLYEDNRCVAAVHPEVTKEEDTLILTADFSDVALDGDATHAVVLGEASVAAALGEFAVNRPESVVIEKLSGVEILPSGLPDAEAPLKVSVSDGTLYVSGCQPGSTVTLTTIDGKGFVTAVVTDGNVTLPVPGAGIYILSSGADSVKILVD